MVEPIQDEATGDPAEAVETRPVGELELEVVFEVGRLRLPVSQLEVTQPGYVFRLASDLRQPVVLRVGGAVIGRGTLVTVGESLGVELSTLRIEEI